MKKIYTAQDVIKVIRQVEELNTLNAELEKLLHYGSNDEMLIIKKREAEKTIRNFKSLGSESIDDEIELEGEKLKQELNKLVSKYEERKRRLQEIINGYGEANSD
jgi:hypothetical protein